MNRVAEGFTFSGLQRVEETEAAPNLHVIAPGEDDRLEATEDFIDVRMSCGLVVTIDTDTGIVSRDRATCNAYRTAPLEDL